MSNATIPRTEEELLEREEARARAGIESGLRGLAEDLCLGVDVGKLARDHPLETLGIGLCAAALLGSRFRFRWLMALGRIARPAWRAARKVAGGAAISVVSSALRRWVLGLAANP
jgi:hypothetical protein